MITQLAQPFISSWDKYDFQKEKEYNLKDILSALVQKKSKPENFYLLIDNQSKLPQLRKDQVTFQKCESSLTTEKAEWLTSKQAAHYLQVSEGTLRNMVSNGMIPYTKLGRSNRYSLNELRQLLLSKKRGALHGN